MPKTLTKHGNSYALVIDKPILELLKITPETLLELSTDGDVLIIKALRDADRQKKLDETLKGINKRYANALKKLAE